MSTPQTGYTASYATAEPSRGPGVAAEVPQTARPASAAAGKARKARLVVSHVDPWSVMKLAFLLSFVMAIVFVVAVLMIWRVLDGMGVFTSLADQIGSITADPNGGGFRLLDYTSMNRVVGAAIVLALVDVVLITALSTLGAFVYNVSASLVGGLHVTLAEDS